MPNWGKLGRTGLAAVSWTILATVAVWCGPAMISVSLAAGGHEVEVARAVDAADEENTQETAPWTFPAAKIEAPALGPDGVAQPGLEPGIPIQPTDDRLVEKLVEWVHLRDKDEEQSFGTITAFIEANPGWPKLWSLRSKAERAIAPENSDRSILAWFKAHPPRTVEGATAYAEALGRSGARDKMIEVVRHAWIRFDMAESDEKSFLTRFGAYIESGQDRARLDRLLWDNRRTAANRQMRRVGEEYRALAEARLLLMRRKRNAPTALDKVPGDLASDQGLIYEWVRWNRRQDRDDVAVETLLTFAGSQTHKKRWWTERQILARRALRDGDAKTAYRLIRDHGLTDGVGRAEAEFLAGWIALRFLSMPHAAFGHFSALYEDVRTPISRSRAAYWSGRAAEAAGEQEISRQWYRTAARNVTTFYGQLAGRRIGVAAVPMQSYEPQITDTARADFDRDELVRAVRLLVALRDAPRDPDAAADGDAADPRPFLASLGDDTALLPFLRHIARRADSPGEWALAARLARDSGRVDIAVHIARRSARDGILLGNLGYPTMILLRDMPPEPALLHAVIRQESAFDVTAHSRAGARGLMQLMPATAKRVARQLKVKGHSTARLTSDPRHNLMLGGAYLDSMLARYEGSMIMALAAYNAGPHRVDQWLEDYGDPRGTLDEAIDWIESIPFSETRNYVQRIMEALPIYRQRLGEAQVAALRAEDIAGQLPGYEASVEP